MNQKTILVIEDEQDIRETIVEILQSEGYTVLSAENGQIALEILRRMKSACLVLLDLMMPVMNGMEFLKVQTQDISIAPIPVVAVSAVTDLSKASLAKAFIKKPVDIDLLLSAVKSFCGMPCRDQ